MAFQFLGERREPRSQFDIMAGALAQGLDFYTKKKMMEESPEYQMAQARLGAFQDQRSAMGRIRERSPLLADAAEAGIQDPTWFMNPEELKQRGTNLQLVDDPEGFKKQFNQEALTAQKFTNQFNRDTAPARMRGLELGNQVQEQQVSSATYTNSSVVRKLQEDAARMSLYMQNENLKIQREQMQVQREGHGVQMGIARMNRDMAHEDKLFQIESQMNNTLTQGLFGVQKELANNQQLGKGWTPTLASNLVFAGQTIDRMYAGIYSGAVKANPQGYAAGNALSQANLWSSAVRDLQSRGKDKNDPLMRTAVENQKHWEENLKVFPEVLAKYKSYWHAPYEEPQKGFFGKWLPAITNSWIPDWYKSEYGDKSKVTQKIEW